MYTSKNYINYRTTMARRYAQNSEFYINPSELKLAHLLTNGHSQKTAAIELNISQNTIGTTVTALYRRIERIEELPEHYVREQRALMYLFQVGLLPISDEDYNQL